MTVQGGPASIADFLDEVETVPKTLLIVNRTEPEQFRNLLEGGLAGQPVDVEEAITEDGDQNVVCLVEDGTTVAMSPLEELVEAYLLVNADRYRTGTRQLESGSFPDVLVGLDDVEFTVRGYPHSAKEKLLLILVSRFVEFRALEAGSGTLHSCFQRLSRLGDELGTKRVYRWLGDSEVGTHIYGVGDDLSAVADLDVTVHTGSGEELRRSWIVTFTPDTPSDQTSPEGDRSGAAAGSLALVAVETGPNVWRGLWTFDDERVARVERYLETHFQNENRDE